MTMLFVFLAGFALGGGAMIGLMRWIAEPAPEPEPPTYSERL